MPPSFAAAIAQRDKKVERLQKDIQTLNLVIQEKDKEIRRNYLFSAMQSR